MRKLAIISMSGGLDSATLAAEALHRGYDLFILNFNYGQKNIVEMKAFENLVSKYQEIWGDQIIGIKQLDLTKIFDEFTSIWQQMRDAGDIKEQAKHEFYTPARNLFFAVLSTVIGEIIALAKGYDEVNIGLGLHKHSEAAYGEHKDYWDITPEFAKRLQRVLELDDVKQVKLFTPFVELTKADVVKRAKKLSVPITETWTCYNPVVEDGVATPCLKCEACVERQLAGEAAGVDDINDYQLKL